MSRESIEADFKSKQFEIGRTALSALFPNDFEAYMLALELVNSNGDSVDYFSWPVLPKELRETHPELTKVTKTIGGVYTTKNTTFNPRQIFLKGTFGRRFKLLLNNNQVSFAGFSLSQKSGKFSITPPNFLGSKAPEFSSFAKTGYGCIKVLESMKDKSKAIDDNGKPFALYFYNPILGNNYQVEINRFVHSQDENQSNMLPEYTLEMTATAPLDTLFARKEGRLESATRNLATSMLQKKANNIANSLKLIPRFN